MKKKSIKKLLFPLFLSLTLTISSLPSSVYALDTASSDEASAGNVIGEAQSGTASEENTESESSTAVKESIGSESGTADEESMRFESETSYEEGMESQSVAASEKVMKSTAGADSATSDQSHDNSGRGSETAAGPSSKESLSGNTSSKESLSGNTSSEESSSGNASSGNASSEAVSELSSENSAAKFSAIAEDSLISENTLNSYDFSSKRLLVAGDIIDPEDELSSYDGVHLMQYEDEQTAKYAYSYYYGKAEFVDIDSTVSVAIGEGGAAASSEMSEEDNPLTELAQTPPASGGSNVIALIDTGVKDVSNVIASVSMLGDDATDDNGHGTKMAELIARINPDAEIISIKALGADGTGDVSSVYAALEYAIRSGAGIINLSISSAKKAENAAIASAISEAEAAGIRVVAAAGNNGTKASYYIPGSLDGVITIGAADDKGIRLSSSNYGDCVEYNVIADSTSEAAAIYSGLLSAGLGGVDEKTVFPADYISEEESESPHEPGATSGKESADEAVSGETGKESADETVYGETETVDLMIICSTGQQTDTITRGQYFRWDNVEGQYLYRSDGHLIWCSTPFASSPAEGAEVKFDYIDIDESSAENLQLLAKAMYYGCGGGGNILTGFDQVTQAGVTHFACAKIWMVYMGNNYGYSWDSCGDYSLDETGHSYVENYLNTISNMPAVQGRLYTANYYNDNTRAQDLVYGDFEPIPEKGYLKLVKSSADTSVTDENDSYSLLGAVYTVYSDSSCVASVSTLTTDADGSTETLKVTPGTYYIRETTAPKGYAKDSAVYNVTVSSDNTSDNPAVVDVSDTPNMDPIGLLLKKKDAVTGEDVRHVGQ